MLDLAVLSVFGFSGYAALLAAAPLWVVQGAAATTAEAGLVNGVLLAATVLTQLAVPRALRRWSTGPVLVAGLLLLGSPAPAYLLSTDVWWALALSAVRGMGFGILTVVGSTVVASLVPAHRRGAAIGAYGLSVAVPNLLLLPASVPVVEHWGFGPVFWLAALPVLGVPAAIRLARVLGEVEGRRPPVDEVTSVDWRTAGRIARPTLVLFTVTMAGGALFTFAPQLTDAGTATLVLLVVGVTAALSRWLVGSLADRWGARRFLAPVLAGAGAAMAACAWAVRHEQNPVLIAAATAFGLFYGALQNVTLLVAFAVVRPAQVPSASAGWNIGFDAGTASGSVLTGVLAATYSFPVALASLAVICLLGALSAPFHAPAVVR